MEKRTFIEADLYSKIAEGDEQAFEHVYGLLRPRLTAYLFKLLKSKDAVAEVLQESMIRFWLNRDKIPEIRQPEAWLFRIVANECFRFFQKNNQRRKISGDIDMAQHHDTGTPETDRLIAFRETQRIIAQVVGSLPARHREIYRLSREEGLKMQEIADRTGLSFRYVKKVLMAALKTIRTQLISAGRLSPLFFIFF